MILINHGFTVSVSDLNKLQSVGNANSQQKKYFS
jgi:hypothetical protein